MATRIVKNHPPASNSRAKPRDGATPATPALVVGVGASAGGLRPISTLLTQLKPGCGLAVIIVQHLGAGDHATLTSICRGKALLTVIEAAEGMPLLADHIHVMPGGGMLSTVNGRFSVQEAAQCQNMRMPIDHFLCTLAADQGPRSIGILLSGTGKDGTEGLAAIKAAGGATAAQDPQTAEFPEMPASAIAAGHVDAVLAPERLGAFLADCLVESHRLTAERDEGSGLEAVLAAVRDAIGHDFHCYKRPTLARRTRRRMAAHRLDSYDDYARMIRANREEAAALRKDLLIGVTEFFRQAEAWSILEQKVITGLIRSARPGSALRVWVPACSTGKEAYSVAMLMVESMEQSGKKLGLQVFATDTDVSAVDIARNGLYAEEDTKGLSAERLARFCVRKGGRYEIMKELRSMMVFAPQDLMADPPFSNLDLVTCRNLLIYLDQTVQRKIIQLLHFALREGGYLFLGSAETTCGEEDLFEAVSRKWRIYRKTGMTTAMGLDLPLRPQNRLVAREQAAGPRTKPTLPSITHQAIAERYGPAAAVVDRKGALLYAHGNVRDFLELPLGETTGMLADAAREGLRNRLASALSQAVTENRKIAAQGRLRKDNKSIPIKITISPIRHPREADGLLMVTFEPIRLPKAAPAGAADETPHADSRTLEDELKIAREELSSTIDQLELYNEQLKALNEEVTSANEELQSANEELETSKEELQTLNEELNTVNQRLQEKIVELEQASDDVSNLLTSASIATVFLDKELKVRRFTPAVTNLFSLVETDLGRPLADIHRKFKDDVLLDRAQQVLADLKPEMDEVRTEDGRWYLRRILPYRTNDDRVEGVVIAFGDVTVMKLTETKLAYLASFPGRNPNPIMEVDLDGGIRYANAATARLFPGIFEGGTRHPYLADWTTVVKPFRESLANTNSRELVVGERAYEQLMYFIAQDRIVRIYGHDITDRKRAEDEARKLFHKVQEEKDKLSSLIDSISDEVWFADTAKRFTLANPSALREFGGSAADIMDVEKLVASLEVYRPDGTPRPVEEAPPLRALKGELVRNNDEIVRTPATGDLRHRQVSSSPVRNASGDIVGSVSVVRDITEAKRAEEAVAAARERLQHVLASITEGYFVLDDQWRFVEMNEVAEQHFGHSAEHLIGKNVWHETGIGPGTLVHDKLHEAAASSLPVSFEVESGLHPGRWFEMHPHARAGGLDVYFHDITDRKRAEQALSDGEDRLRFALETSRTGAWDLDLASHTAFRSLEHDRIFGYTEMLPQWTYELFLEHVLPDDRAEVDKKFSQAVATHGDWSFECRIRRADGEVRWIWAAGRYRTEKSGGDNRMAGIVQDITERKRAELAWRESELFLKESQQIARVGSWKTDPRTGFLEWSDEVYEIVEAPRRYKPALEEGLKFYLPEYRPILMEKLARCLATGESFTLECQVMTTSGRILWTEVRGLAPVADGERSYVKGTFQDITERKRAEEALRHAKEQSELLVRERTAELTEAMKTIRQTGAYTRSLIESSMDPLVTIGRDGTITDVNMATETATGRARQELIGTDFSTYFTEPEMARKGYRQVFNEGSIRDYPLEIRHREGHTIPVLYNAALYRDEAGQVVGIFAAARDITERKRAEFALREANEQLAGRAAQLRALAGELTLTEQRERRRLAKVLHDHLQQLLVGAKFRAAILGRSGDEIIRNGAAEIERLLDESINASRSLTAELSPPILHDAGLLTGLKWLARWMGDKHGLVVDLAVDQDIPPLVEDVKILLFESVRELLFNAVKHARVHTAAVNVRLIEGKALHIIVSDSGPGFDPAGLKPAGTAGAGFGLFSIGERLDLIGGRMEIESKPGEGSRIVLITPIANAVLVAPKPGFPATARGADLHVAPRTSPIRGAKIRVMLADDHAIMRQGLASLLGAEPDIEIVGQACDGEEAVQLAGRLTPDVILMDMSMPKLNGVEATRAIRRSHPGIRIIGLTMFEESEHAQEMRDAGAVNYLTKSGPAADLLASIRACASGAADRGPRPNEAAPDIGLE